MAEVINCRCFKYLDVLKTVCSSIKVQKFYNGKSFKRQISSYLVERKTASNLKEIYVSRKHDCFNGRENYSQYAYHIFSVSKIYERKINEYEVQDGFFSALSMYKGLYGNFLNEEWQTCQLFFFAMFLCYPKARSYL